MKFSFFIRKLNIANMPSVCRMSLSKIVVYYGSNSKGKIVDILFILFFFSWALFVLISRQMYENSKGRLEEFKEYNGCF